MLPDFRLYYRAIIYQKNMVLVQKHTYKLMEQDRQQTNHELIEKEIRFF